MPPQRIALVTGGSRGIGRAVCELLARVGFRVHLAFHNRAEAADQVVNAIEAAGGQARVHCADLADEAQARQLVASVLETEGRLDVLVNNAAVVEDQLVALTTEVSWQRVLAVNLTAPFVLIREVLPAMLDQGSGRIINISSSSVARPGPGQAAYAASKGGLEALTRAVASEVGHKGIRVNAVAPGFVATDMTAELMKKVPTSPGRPWGKPEQIAEVVAFLASDASDYLQGQVLLVDGGRGVSRGSER